MFVSSANSAVGAALTREKTKESLAILAERTRPTASSQTRLLPVAAPLAALFPDRSLRRGSTIVVTGGGTAGTVGGGVTLALALLGRASHAGSWCAAVGIPGVGAVAARDLGIDLVRFALVPRPGPAWAEATAAMIDGADLVVLCPPFPPRPAMARRLIARAKERRAILIVLPGRAGWPECPDMRLTIDAVHWDGIGTGEGYLRRRRMTVTATGRRSATRPVVQPLWLPSPTGAIETTEAAGRGPELNMDRLLVVRCPQLLEEDEGGAALRQFIQVIGAVEAYCPWITVVRPGICSLPARGPARYFGGEEALVVLIAAVAAEVTPVEVGIADGLFAAVLAARTGLVVPPGKTREFLAPFSVEALGNPELAELLARLGLRTIGDFASLPEPHVLGRFGADGVVCHLVASGQSGELREPGELRLSATGRRVDRLRNRGPVVTDQSGFWGGVSDTDARAARALAAVQHLLGPDSVVTVRLQGGRSPSEQARFVTWNAHEAPDTSAVHAPWPGRIPPPAPATVHADPLPAELVDGNGTPVAVSGRGLLTAIPDRLSVERHPWTAVTAWAGPWPSDERWWSRSRRRSARMQVVTGAHARLLLAERGRWWVEATYD